MGKILLFVALSGIVFLFNAGAGCKLNKKKMEKKIKLFEKCLERGYKPIKMLGCSTTDIGGMKKKEKKRCVKAEKALIKCGYVCPVDGGWTEFGAWSTCSATCGGGSQSRQRTCTNPAPQYGGRNCQGQAVEKRSCNTHLCPPSWPGDFRWSSGGPIHGYNCVQIRETAEPSKHTWTDNYFCSRKGKANPGIRWSSGGPISGLKCVQILETADPHTWDDNYLCVPHNSPYNFRWSSARPVPGLRCIRWVETSDPHTWDDNYLCA